MRKAMMMNKGKKKLIPALRFPEFGKEGEWEEKSLEYLTVKIGDGIHTTPKYDPSGEYYFINGNNLIEDKIVVDEKTKRVSSEEFEIHKKDLTEKTILLSINGTIGNLAFYKNEMVVLGKSACYITPSQKLNNVFLYYSLQSPRIIDYFFSELTGSTIKNLSLKSIRETLINLPSEKEQQKIASCLSSLDEVIAAHSQKLDLLKDHKKGLMQNLFPQEGEKVPKFRFKEFEKDGEWVEKKLGEVCENVMYGMNAAATSFDGENKYLRITDIDESTRLFLQNSLTSPDGTLEDKYLLKVGDLVFARTGASVGKTYLHQTEDGRVYFAGFLIKFSIKNYIPYFIYSQTLTEQYKKWIIKTSMRSGQPGINAEEYKSYSFFVPPSFQEQQKIASCLSSLDALITAQAEKIAQLKLHKKGLMQGLFPKIKE